MNSMWTARNDGASSWSAMPFLRSGLVIGGLLWSVSAAGASPNALSPPPAGEEGGAPRPTLSEVAPVPRPLDGADGVVEKPDEASVSSATSVPLTDLLAPRFGDGPEGRFLRAYYQDRAWAPHWVAEGQGLTPRGHRLVDALEAAAAQGLDSQAYHLEDIRRLVAKGDGESLAQAEIRASAALLTHLSDLLLGQTRRFMGFDKRMALLTKEEGLDPRALLANGGAAPDPAIFLAGLAPDTDQYALLIAGRNRYARLAADHAWTGDIPFEGLSSIKPGEADDRVPAIRARLRVEGDLVAEGEGAPDVSGPKASEGMAQDVAQADPRVLDPVTEAAVRRFQDRHGLEKDGVVGRQTLAHMNVPPQDLLATIDIALERWRLLPRSLGTSHVFVNVPRFELFVVEGRNVVLSMPVAVGRTIFETPLFSDAIEYMEFNPYWNVPVSIARNEVIPKQAHDPDYLARQGFTVMTRDDIRETVDHESVDWTREDSAAQGYRLRQAPGPGNPLGTVKFMFPNSHAVYLHDTNGRSVFSRSNRAVSHGCIRVGDPKGLADYILANRTGLPGKVAENFRGSKPRIVTLKDVLPVHLAYITAWGMGDGAVGFSDDVYGKDSALRQALKDSAVVPGPDATVASR
jgi:murein L,D-transpeptidase YcbB/YkuD